MLPPITAMAALHEKTGFALKPRFPVKDAANASRMVSSLLHPWEPNGF
jgi:hypothetical protein